VKATWTAEQDEQLLMLVALYGEKCWTRVAMGIGNRCDVQCRYRYNVLKKSEGFSGRFATASSRVHKCPALAGRLVPLARGKRVCQSTVKPPERRVTGGDEEEIYGDEEGEGEEIYGQSESSRTFEETEESDFDDSDE
jgi:hypothetical protein